MHIATTLCCGGGAGLRLRRCTHILERERSGVPAAPSSLWASGRLPQGSALAGRGALRRVGPLIELRLRRPNVGQGPFRGGPEQEAGRRRLHLQGCLLLRHQFNVRPCRPRRIGVCRASEDGHGGTSCQ